MEKAPESLKAIHSKPKHKVAAQGKAGRLWQLADLVKIVVHVTYVECMQERPRSSSNEAASSYLCKIR